MIAWLSQPWPWYITGPILGLMVPLLLFFGNKHFGVSSTFRDICAAALPLKADYFKYDWKSKSWNLVMMAGVIIGALLAVFVLDGDRMPEISSAAQSMFQRWGLTEFSRLQPTEVFALANILTPQNLILLVVGGFFVGFGTRYGNGCTSGHAIMGLSLLNLGSLVAVIGFFGGGVIISNLLLPAIMSLR